MRFLTIGLLACGLTVSAPVGAQDAEHLGLARDMLQAMKAADNFDAVVPTVMNALKPALTAGNPKAAKDYDEIMPAVTKEFAAAKGSMLDEVAMIYAKSFTKPELRELSGFYKTPTGEKMARLTPVMAQQMMAAGQRYGQQVATQLTERMRDELRKRGNKI